MVTGQAIIGLLPEILSVVLLLATLLAGVFVERSGGLVTFLAALGALAAFVSAAVLMGVGFSGTFFGGGYVVDDFALFTKLVVSGAAFFTILAAGRWARKTGDGAEYLVLILSVVFGAMLLVSMRDLFGVFLALELATIPSYAMVAFDRSRAESAEGGMKYIVTGMIASSVLVYGIVLIYGFSGSANLSDVASAYAGGLTPVGLLGLALLLSGFAFKLSAAPFHFWTPDAYQGAPTSAAAFLSTGPKAAIFVALLRILVEGMPQAAPTWTTLLAVIAIASMFAGNLLALRQHNVRRMLAYSSVAHSGYILAAFAALQGGGVRLGVQAVLIYVAIYAVMNLGAFFVVDLVGEEAKSYNGLFKSWPAVALAMGVFMVALTGVPPFAGFFGKMWVILADARSGFWLAYVVIAAVVINSAISLAYYFGIVRNMFLEEPSAEGFASGKLVPEGTGALRFVVYALAVVLTLGVVFIGALAALTGFSGLS